MKLSTKTNRFPHTFSKARALECNYSVYVTRPCPASSAPVRTFMIFLRRALYRKSLQFHVHVSRACANNENVGEWWTRITPKIKEKKTANFSLVRYEVDWQAGLDGLATGGTGSSDTLDR